MTRGRLPRNLRHCGLEWNRIVGRVKFRRVARFTERWVHIDILVGFDRIFSRRVAT
jgi:hypothetical protein